MKKNIVFKGFRFGLNVVVGIILVYFGVQLFFLRGSKAVNAE